jgi:two-component system, NtrC family, nitrogen regulation sensor histidine kinase NtrY
MSFRSRLFLAFLLLLLVPLSVLAIGVRREMERRVTTEYRERVRSLAELVRLDLAREGEQITRRLAALRRELASDNRFRTAAVQEDPAMRAWQLDWAGDARGPTGLDYLWLQDSAGRVLSSGHFRNEFDRVEPDLARLLATAGGVPALLRARTANGEVLVVARIDSFRVAGRLYRLIGGKALDIPALAPAAQARGLGVHLRLPDQPSGSGDSLGLADAFAVTLVDAREPGSVTADTASVIVTQSLAPLAALRRSVDAWFLAALAATAATAVLVAVWLSARVSRPLRDLAEKTSRLDLDRLDVGFGSDRSDEIGALARLLDAMAGRLRDSAARLREAERRATVGDLARQVNHDVKNGLLPIRHVLAHFDEVARREPAAMARVFAERRGTLESSVAYLETLARNYARLSPTAGPATCDVNAVAREVAAGAGAPDQVHLELAQALPPAQADAVLVRRILENLVRNGIESLDGTRRDGVTLSTAAAEGGVRVTVRDAGRGMSKEELDRALEGFYSTKPGGSGLGLTIVRRLVQDIGGRLRIETQPAAGSRFTIELPTARSRV